VPRLRSQDQLQASPSKMWLPINLLFSLTVTGIHFVAITDVVHAIIEGPSCPKSSDGPCPQQVNELHGISETKKETVRKKEDDSSVKSVRASYVKSAITNDEDFKIRVQLDEADDLLEKGFHMEARQTYVSILRKHPSPRAAVGVASALQKQAYKEHNHELLYRSITVYKQLLTLPGMPVKLMVTAGIKLADLHASTGQALEALKTLHILADKYPEEVEIVRELGITYMSFDRYQDAKRIFEKILKDHPHDGHAMAELGMIYGLVDLNPAKAIPLLKAGLDSDQKGTQDARFYAALCSCLRKQGRTDEARKVKQRGTGLGLFPSLYQYSSHNVESLTGRPWWTPEQTGYQEHLELLEKHWRAIRDEGLTELHSHTSLFTVSQETHLVKTGLGNWKQLVLYDKDRRPDVCARVPKTCQIIERIRPARTCTAGQVKFSVMYPGTEVWAHSGPSNYRLRAHLGLVVDKGAKLQVVNETRTWTEGKIFVFDDSFQHAVWHYGKSLRLILIVDFWHPEMSESMKGSLH
ncbi:hypothetical protein BaRGS_00019012, partial [Batillaria attramentaria]